MAVNWQARVLGPPLQEHGCKVAVHGHAARQPRRLQPVNVQCSGHPMHGRNAAALIQQCLDSQAAALCQTCYASAACRRSALIMMAWALT